MKIRLDQRVVELGLAESREQARRLILAGRIRCENRILDKPGRAVEQAMPLELTQPLHPYVSRGGVKLEAALTQFSLTHLSGRRTLDIGASTGGFTDCMLAHGADQVHAVDTGQGKIHARLRDHPRVRLHEKTNARYLEPSIFGNQRFDLIAIDVSFISLRLILPVCPPLLEGGGSVIVLVKPQFEAGRGAVGKKGIVRDREVHRSVLEAVVQSAQCDGWRIGGIMASPLLGARGNAEFFILLRRAERAGSDRLSQSSAAIQIEQALDAAYNLRRAPR
jgi:23S rRNA (cytidine1920-2'-O)/16S rRNA (cytidine1409-2'-O)-methyltransferase